MLDYIKDVLENMPSGWLSLTTHRLDIYDENLAKTQFLDQLQNLFNDHNFDSSALSELPTAYDYIRLGHPLSSILEWVIANLNNLNPESVISFSSKTVPILAILRKNLLDHKNTQILYKGELPGFFDTEILQRIYGYKFDLKRVESKSAISKFNGSTIFISQQEEISKTELTPNIDFFINVHANLGSVLLVNGAQNEAYISEIQHVRRRDTIAMTPINCLAALKSFVGQSSFDSQKNNIETNKTQVLDSITAITGTTAKPLVASSGLSIQ